MKYPKINTTHKLLLFILLASFCSSFFVSQSRALDYILSQEIVAPTAPNDACPNIPGIQPSIPNGMQLDSAGNCYTPAPPTPPTPPQLIVVDLCKNINGVQATLPSGYFRTNSGNCYQQPTPPAPPTDVCSNIDGIQTEVPDGYQIDDETNNCVKIKKIVDKCPNIPGIQATMPDGMKLDNDVCYTPATSTTPTDSVPPNDIDAPYIERVPGFMQPITRFIMSALPEETKQWLRSLPNSSAVVIPYYIFILVAILALVPILQSIREAIFAHQIALLVRRERGIAEQKDNFIALASHYLRTPLTLMNYSLDTTTPSDTPVVDKLQSLRVELLSLDTNIQSILKDITNNEALRHIGQPSSLPAPKSVWRSGWFWGPIVTSIIVTAIVNFLLVVVGGKSIGVSHTFFHFLVAIIAFFVLYAGVRNLYMQRRLHAENKLLIEHEKTIDDARNTFISQTTDTLQSTVERISQQSGAIQDSPSAGYFYEGLSRMEAILHKFVLLTQIQTGVDRDTEMININEAVDNSIVMFNTAISEKRLTVTNATSPTYIKQNRVLFNFVLNSILDNAIKFNKDGGTIEISMEPKDKLLIIKVSDSGVGINDEKLSQLFKPFSRASSAVEFNYEGLGFSLFLNKIIMDYTGGEIDADSAENHGTKISIATPLVKP